MISVTLVGQPHLSDRHVAMCAWSSTDKDEDALTCPEENVVRLIRFLMRNRPPHASPFGHPHITVKGEIPLFACQQWLRHRAWASYSQKSLRYVDADDVFWVPSPDEMRSQAGKYAFEALPSPAADLAVTRMRAAYGAAMREYKELLLTGVAREVARAVLPAGLMTKLYGTVSLRNALNFLVLRAHPHAQQEMQEIAGYLEDILNDCYPITMRAWNEYGRPQL